MNTIAGSLREHSLIKSTLRELRVYKNKRQQY